ncbi:hypothetical protein LJR230_004842 [Trinickia sp. LjRoot230]|uniref:S10 family serine carboxypeptidase-like protein n=1 Tax=Trinickia sp. LjRoot230 TaxID=3342288 RepID=UPI003ECEC8B7
MLVIGGGLYSELGAVVPGYQHVVDDRSESAGSNNGDGYVASPWKGNLETDFEQLERFSQSVVDDVFEFFVADRWIGNEHVASTIALDPQSKDTVRDLEASEGLLLYDALGRLKPASAGRKLRLAPPLTEVNEFKIFESMPNWLVMDGIIAIGRFSDRRIREIVRAGAYHDASRAEPIAKWLIRRKRTLLQPFRRQVGANAGHPPLRPGIRPNDPFLQYLRQKTLSGRATLELASAMWPGVFFSGGGQLSGGVLEYRPPHVHSQNEFGQRIERPLLRVTRDINFAVIDAIFRRYQQLGSGWAKLPSGATAYGLNEAGMILAGDPQLPPGNVAVFPARKEDLDLFVTRKSFLGEWETSHALEPPLVVDVRPRDLRPSLYTLPTSVNPGDPEFRGFGALGGVSDETLVFTMSDPPLARIKPPVPPPVSKLLHPAPNFREIDLGKIDKQHPYVAEGASSHLAASVLLEEDQRIWLIEEDDGKGGTTLRLPKQTVAASSLRSEAAAQAVRETLGFEGPIVAYIGDFDDSLSNKRTRYFIQRRQDCSQDFLTRSLSPARLVPLCEAASTVHDPEDKKALSNLHAQLNPPTAFEELLADVQSRGLVGKAAVEALEKRGMNDADVQSLLALGQYQAKMKIAQSPVVFEDSVDVDGQPMHYVGRYTPLYVGMPGKPKTQLCMLEFERKDAGPDEPTIVIQGGGPGGSPAWFIGAGVGPIRIDGMQRMVPNAHSLLRGARILFVESPATGYSFSGGDEKEYFDLEADAEITALGLLQYRKLNHDRLAHSAWFIAEASYGVHRGVRIANRFEDENVRLGGLIFVSGAFSFGLRDFERESIVPYALVLRSYAATAVHHGVVPRPTDERAFLKEVDDFARTEYVTALMGRTDPNSKAFDQMAKKLSQYIGLPAEYFIDKKSLQVEPLEFCSSLIPGQPIAILDGRDKVDALPTTPKADPFAYVLEGAARIYGQLISKYLRDKGYVPLDRPRSEYVVLKPLAPQWDWRPYQNKFARVQAHLVKAMERNQHLRLLTFAGTHDVRSPVSVHEFGINHLPPEAAARVELHEMEGGHMFYRDLPTLERFVDIVLEFVSRQIRTMHDD